MGNFISKFRPKQTYKVEQEPIVVEPKKEKDEPPPPESQPKPARADSEKIVAAFHGQNQVLQGASKRLEALAMDSDDEDT